MKVIILGSGNVATIVGIKIKEASHEILQVLSRDPGRAKMLGERLGCVSTNDFRSLSYDADIYMVALSDDALYDLHEVLNLNQHLVVHTAGSVPISILSKISKNYGVMYPLQSLRKEMTEIPGFPLLIDGNTADSLTLIHDFAETLSGQVKHASDAERLRLHLAAVISNNFTNHLLALTEDFCRKENVDFDLLLPLIKETANRLQSKSPAAFQTGPAVRNDFETIRSHIKMLDHHSELKKIYETMTDSIRQIRNQTVR